MKREGKLDQIGGKIKDAIDDVKDKLTDQEVIVPVPLRVERDRNPTTTPTARIGR